jgi:hypothetical protein
LQPDRINIFQHEGKLLQTVVIAVANHRRIIVVHFESDLPLQLQGKFFNYTHPENATAAAHVDHPLWFTWGLIKPFDKQLLGDLIVEREVNLGEAVDVGVGQQA